MSDTLCCQAAKAFARARGHNMSRWTADGLSECAECEACLVASDAVAFVRRGDVSSLGTLGLPCPRPWLHVAPAATTPAA